MLAPHFGHAWEWAGTAVPHSRQEVRAMVRMAIVERLDRLSRLEADDREAIGSTDCPPWWAWSPPPG
jgi:hypothetical protein